MILHYRTNRAEGSTNVFVRIERTGARIPAVISISRTAHFIFRFYCFIFEVDSSLILYVNHINTCYTSHWHWLMAYPNMPSLQPLKLPFCWFLIIIPVFKARDPVQSIFWEKIHGNSLDVRVFEEKLYFAENLPWLMHESTNSAKILKIVKNSGWNSYPMSICTKIWLEEVSELQNRFFIVICQI